MKHCLTKKSLISLLIMAGIGFNSFTIVKAEATSANVVMQQKKGRTVTGTVTDAADGTPIIGANILLKGSKIGVISDLDGNFSIQVNNTSDILVVSYIGYKSREIAIGNLGIVDIKLTSDNETLDEVVIVGSGTQKKVSITGAISTVKGLTLKAPSSSLTNSLAGKMAGVIVNTTSGEPGSTSDFYIRGISTFGGRATPLILLDDVEISSGDLNNIPPETIESFSILKDASATAIYGARGANGVMLITTKRGEENSKVRVNVTMENSFNTLTNFPDFVDGATWMDLYNEAQLTRNPGLTTGRYSQETIDATRNKINPYVYPSVDWGDLLFKDMTMNQRANVNISGGGQNITYYMSVNVAHDTGLLDSPKYYSWDNNINNMMYNFQNNLSIKLTSTTKIDLNMNAQIINKKGTNTKLDNIFQMALFSNPINFPAIFPAQDGDRHPRFGNAILTGNTLRNNPYASLATTFGQTDANTLNTALRINQQLDFITKGLSVNALFNFKNWSSSYYSRTIEPYYYRVKNGSYDATSDTYEMELLKNGTEYIKQSDISKSSDRTIALQFQVNYARSFGWHNVGGMLMYMQRDYKSGVLPERNQGLSGRFTYDYANRYLVEFNFGYNGTERLAKGNRFEFFPAMSLGWVVSNEKFFEGLQGKIDKLKVRASYGAVGNDDTGTNYGHFLYLNNVNLSGIGFTTGYDWNTTLYGPTISNYAVSNACWERAQKMDIGLDLTLFSNWEIVLDYFYEKRSSILMPRYTWPNILGYNATPWGNVGKVDNWGWEVSTSYMHQIDKNWTVDFRANFTYARNEYTYLDEPNTPYPWKVENGRSLSTYEGYIAEGLFQSEEDIANSPEQQLGSTPQVGDIKYRDLNGDGVITSDDKGFISEYSKTPRIQYGFGFNINYKKFDLGVFFNGSAMRKVMISSIHPFGENDQNIFQFVADKRWTEENPNPNAEYPRLGLTESLVANNCESSTYWLRNGNFLRFKTLEVGYRFKYGRIYFSGDNLAVFSPFKLWDPELAWYKYPLQRTFNIGLQLSF